jgi:ubiquinone/menaquinone biosynthesis C-methylase UbiE
MAERLLSTLYNADTVERWQQEKAMRLSSGIWGREPTLRYLGEQVLKIGHFVVDLGTGGGFLPYHMSQVVGPTGQVIGIDLSEVMIAAARAHFHADNLVFQLGDMTRELPIERGSVDAVTSFMVMHNITLDQIGLTFREVARILKPDGSAVMLTMHPDAFDSDWELDFLSYDSRALQQYREAFDHEGLLIPGRAKNSNGDENDILTIYHTRENLVDAARRADLGLAEERDFWIDQTIAAERFGANENRRFPAAPMYWMFHLKKSHTG